MARRPTHQPDFDRELSDLPAEMRWREWKARVEAVLFAAPKPVGCDVLERVVGRGCALDLLLDDLREDLRGRPIELVRAGESYTLHTRPAFGPAVQVAFDIPPDAKQLTKLEAGVLMAIAMFQPAKLLMNTYDPFHGTRSYLVPAVFDRIDPLLATVRPMMSGGPTQFVALCMINTLLVSPRARHLDFLLGSVDDWYASLPADASMWIDLGIGRKVMEWFDAAATQDPTILKRNHPLRNVIDLTVGRLVGLGVAKAHELEKRVAAGDPGPD